MNVRRAAGLVATVLTAAALTAQVGTAPASAGTAPASAGMVAGATGCAGAAGVTGGTAPTRQILRLDPGARPDGVAAAVTACGARVIGVQSAIGTLVATVPAERLAAVRELPGVRTVTADYELHTASLGFDPATQAGAMTNVTRVTGAGAMWAKGYTGNGVDVAVIDTGVAPVPGLADKAKVVVGPDLSFESQDLDLRYLDTFGHGTHMAGIIAGRETAKATGATYAADRSNFYGMAPDARLISLKLADHNGAVDISQVIAAVDWVVANAKRDGLNIRVLNLSYGTRSPQSPQVDPLSWATEVAWRNGIVVVASAGNEGWVPGLSNPAYNPWVIAVGAADTKGTDTMADDVVPSFSARQGGNFNTRGIDVVAPGVGVVSLGVPGSYIYDAHPGARVGNGLIRGSGTSQSAAVVSGAAALLLSQRSLLTPDQVKALLVNGATKLTGQDITAQGAGEINLVRSSSLSVPFVVQSQLIGNGGGGLESARGGVHVTMNGQALADERDIMGNSWVGPVMGAKAHLGTAWGSDGSFNGSVWIGTGFTADSTTWAGKTWSGKTWAGKTWTGKTWSNAVWTGKTWSVAGWTTTVGADAWAGSLWATRAWG